METNNESDPLSISSTLSEDEDLVRGDGEDGWSRYAWDERDVLLNKASACLRYHRRRAVFFDRLDKLNKVVTIALSLTFLAEIQKAYTPVALMLSALTLVDLIYGYADKRTQHQRIAEEAAKVTAAIWRVPADLVTTADVARWAESYANVVAIEPPILKNLKLMCEREQFISTNQIEHARKHCPEIKGFRRLVIHFI